MNRLSKESSPYLLQHANNPVEWYPWGKEAFEKASKEDKPVLISIGYSACHWCHVMERESFEDPETAAYMNKHFVNIKIDREERPDIDHIYMDAVQLITGTGGWPLNVFLTPDLRPFYGGTYYPPKPVHNRSSWMEILEGISASFRDRREEVETQAGKLTEHLTKSNEFGLTLKTVDPSLTAFTSNDVTLIAGNILQVADTEWGGFSKEPKFPHSQVIRFLLNHYFHTREQSSLDQAVLTLDKMASGGLYDHVGGGFARYSTDAQWLVPHFEKMLYDNALLVSVYSEAFQLTGNELYREVVDNTLEFVERELMSEEGGFFAALDADSEGEEGRFYVWTADEINDVLGDDAALFSLYYGVTAEGNWERRNILTTRQTLERFASEQGLSSTDLREKLNRSRAKLLQSRNTRVSPGLDDKVLLGWNALMISAYCKAYQATLTPAYLDRAKKSAQFLLSALERADGKGLHHTFKAGEAKFPAFLDDYAFLIAALIQLQEITADPAWLLKAQELMELVIGNYSEKETGFFYYTAYDQDDIIIRKKEIYDSATPSGNATMAINLYALGVLLDKPDWKDRAIQMTLTLRQLIVQYPTSFGLWATFLQSLSFGIPEIVLIGEEIEAKHRDILRTFIPSRLYQSSTRATTEFPLLADKPLTENGLIFLCKDYACQHPVNEIDELKQLLGSG